MEPIAKQKYREVLSQSGHRNLSIRECGLYLHPKFSYIGATPDLIVECACCGLGVVEIKCPVQIVGRKPVAGFPKSLVKRYDGNVSLDTQHRHYTQVQGEMGVVGAKWAHYFVFSTAGYFLEKIEKNQAFWNELLRHLTSFFSSHMLPEFKK